MPVRPLSDHDQVTYDLIIVATLESSGQQVAALIKDGVPPEKLFPLRREVAPKRRNGQGNGQPG